MAFYKKPINCKFGDLGEAKSVYTQTNALTGKNFTTAVHRESLAFMVPEIIIEELLIASAGIDELKTVNVWAASLTFFTILNPDQSYPFQHDLKNIPNKVTSNMNAACKQQLQKKVYPFFSLKLLLLVQAMFKLDRVVDIKLGFMK